MHNTKSLMQYNFLTLLLLLLPIIGISAWSKVPQSRKHFWTDLLFLASAAPLPVNAMITDPKTGIALPEIGEIESSIPNEWIENPFTGNTKSIFGRLDSTPDSNFYTEPRFVEHVDQNAVRAMTDYISNQAIQDSDSILDLCSSWTSHIDTKAKMNLVAGLGMNEIELKANPVLSEYIVRDLNDNPTLPYSDNAFSVVLCQLSIDYLTKPLDIMKEVSRVLKPGGKVHILFSNQIGRAHV